MSLYMGETIRVKGRYYTKLLTGEFVETTRLHKTPKEEEVYKKPKNERNQMVDKQIKEILDKHQTLFDERTKLILRKYLFWDEDMQVACFTRSKAAKILDVSKTTITKWCDEGKWMGRALFKEQHWCIPVRLIIDELIMRRSYGFTITKGNLLKVDIDIVFPEDQKK